MQHSATQRNIKAICEMEREAIASRPLAARISDAVAVHAAKMGFAVLHAIWFVLWIAFNLIAPKAEVFDPYPYSLLTMIVSLESIFLSLFILMSQNRSNLQADRRNHLDLQINLLSEDENTKMIQMLQALCQHHGLTVGNDAETLDLARRTDVTDILSDLNEGLSCEES